MCRLATCLLAVLFAATAFGQPLPDTTYPTLFIPNSAGQLCHFTAPPLIITPSHTFVSYHCFNPDTAYVAHVNLVTMMFSQPVLNASAGVIYRNQPIPITTDTAFVYTEGQGAMAASVRALKGAPEWQWDRHGSDAACTTWQNMAFLPLGPHDVSGMNVTSLLVVDLWSGAALWEKTFSPNSVVGSPIIYEGRVIFPVDLALWSLNITTGPAGTTLKFNNPCLIQALAPGQQLNLQLVQYGKDFNGPLNALMLYAATAGGSGNFTVCRVHHGWNFGLPEWVHSRGDAYDVQGVTAGGGVITFALLNTASGLYSILLYNATVPSGSDPVLQEIIRSSVDRYNIPAVLTGPGNSLPVLAYSKGGQLIGMSISPVAGLQQVWVSSISCARAIALFNDGSSTRGFCVPYSETQPAVSFDYNGTTIWEYPDVVTMYPAIEYRGTSVFLTFFNSIIGLSVDASATMPPGPTSPSGTSPGIIVLIIIIIVLIGVLCFGVWRSVTKKRSARRSASKANEGYTGLNA